MLQHVPFKRHAVRRTVRVVGDSLDSVAQQWAAEEHVANVRTERAVEAMQADAAAPAVVAAKPVDPELVQLSGVLWFVADQLIRRAAGESWKLNDEEQAQLAEKTAPVLAKYLPSGVASLAATPEGALAVTALTVFGAKFAAGALSSAPSPTPTTPAPGVSA